MGAVTVTTAPRSLNWTKVGLKVLGVAKLFAAIIAGLNWTKVGLKERGLHGDRDEGLGFELD